MMLIIPPPAIVAPMAISVSLGDDLVARAKADGWSDSQAGWIGRLGEVAAQSAKGGASLDSAYQAGRLALTVGYFNDAMARDKSRLVAFLTVIDLEKQIALRRGAKAPDYPDDWLQTAYIAVAKAAQDGLSSEEQIEAGYAVLREKARKS
jgi:hypothetical protein